MAAQPFWLSKPLAEMTQAEWESLCDGCGKCCLHKLEDADTGEVFYTDVACRLLDLEQCRCTRYASRLEIVAECVQLRPEDVADFRWLPSSCAYRLVAEGNPLPAWHHLVSGDKSAIHRQGASVKGRAVAEAAVDVDDMEEHIVHWVD